MLSFKIDSLAAEVRDLRLALSGLVRVDLYEEGRRADQRRIEASENGLRDLIAGLGARREADERERAARRWQVFTAVFAAVVSVVLAISDKI